MLTFSTIALAVLAVGGIAGLWYLWRDNLAFLPPSVRSTVKIPVAALATLVGAVPAIWYLCRELAWASTPDLPYRWWWDCSSTDCSEPGFVDLVGLFGLVIAGGAALTILVGAVLTSCIRIVEALLTREI